MILSVNEAIDSLPENSQNVLENKNYLIDERGLFEMEDAYPNDVIAARKKRIA